ncbi:FAD-dependent oxidoreductase [Paenibacillus sp. GCM10027626]|uniref:FAD-dependent oxidoreductase n=1 Tax=Paenibacillus sp. GCM10027626 TaxID=3273411 RepID=UPI003625988F
MSTKKRSEAMFASHYDCDIAVIGGGVGGCAAALAAAEAGMRVVLTEETDWIGGQFTSQAVPADEHPWIEQFGCTAKYREFRNRVRGYYKANYPLTANAMRDNRFNPGNAIVSRLSCDPRVALSVLEDMLAPYIHAGRITLLLHVRPVAADTDGDVVRAVMLERAESGERITVSAHYVLDATECGDLLPLTGTEYVTGAESRRDTGEPHALEGEAEPDDIQSITWCFALDYREGEDHTIAKPEVYDFWRSYQAPFQRDRMFSWTPLQTNGAVKSFSLFPEAGAFSLWNYRRIADRTQFAPGAFDSDITLINWPQNDYWLGSIYDVTEEERQRHLEGARQLSLSLLYWLQTDAPRPDGGTGYPGLRLRGDVTGTADGLAKAPYIRESRRIRAEFTVKEQHISPEVRGAGGSEAFSDSIGVGCYRIDLHPTTGGREGFYIPSFPFQIPLGSLIPIRMENLLPACKNIGVTHLTNGCYRLHPVEWNIGESAGALAAYCLQRGVSPRQVRRDPARLADFQRALTQRGVELAWPSIGQV